MTLLTAYPYLNSNYFQNKDSAESRSRSGSNTSNRGARSGTDRYVGRGGSTQFSSSGMYANIIDLQLIYFFKLETLLIS